MIINKISTKDLETQIRNKLLKKGFLLGKSYAKSPRNPCFGLYSIIEIESGASIGSTGTLPYELSLSEVEKILDVLSGEGQIPPELNQIFNARSAKHR